MEYICKLKVTGDYLISGGYIVDDVVVSYKTKGSFLYKSISMNSYRNYIPGCGDNTHLIPTFNYFFKKLGDMSEEEIIELVKKIIVAEESKKSKDKNEANKQKNRVEKINNIKITINI